MGRKLKQWALGAAAMAAAGMGSMAQAAIVSGSFNYTATFIAGAPITSISGTVTYSFDNSASFSGVTTGFTVTGIPPELMTSGTGMTYFSTVDLLAFGDRLNDVNAPSSNSNDWFLVLDDVTTNPTFSGLVYSRSNSRSNYGTVSGSLTPTASVPEPTAIALLGLGGLGLFAATRTRRRA